MNKLSSTILDFPEIKIVDGSECCKFLFPRRKAVWCEEYGAMVFHEAGRDELISQVLSVGGEKLTHGDEVYLKLFANTIESATKASEIIADHDDVIEAVLTRTVSLRTTCKNVAVISIYYEVRGDLACIESIHFQNIRDRATFEELIDPVKIYKKYFSAKWTRCLVSTWAK